MLNASDLRSVEGDRTARFGARWTKGLSKKVRPTGLRLFRYGYGFSEGSGSDVADRDGLCG
jgi:hypothetical protein